MPEKVGVLFDESGLGVSLNVDRLTKGERSVVSFEVDSALSGELGKAGSLLVDLENILDSKECPGVGVGGALCA